MSSVEKLYHQDFLINKFDANLLFNQTITYQFKVYILTEFAFILSVAVLLRCVTRVHIVPSNQRFWLT